MKNIKNYDNIEIDLDQGEICCCCGLETAYNIIGFTTFILFVVSFCNLIKQSFSSSVLDILIALGFLFVFSFWGVTWA